MGLTTNIYRSSLSKRGAFLLSTLARQDKNIFSSEEAKKILKKNPKKVMSDLIENKWVLHLKRGLYAIVPLDIGSNSNNNLYRFKQVFKALENFKFKIFVHKID